MPLLLSDLPGISTGRYFDAASITGHTNGGALTAWNDSSGSGNHVNAFGAMGATYQANAFRAGLPGVQFTGSTTIHITNSTSWVAFPAMTGVRTVIAVVKAAPNWNTKWSFGPIVGNSTASAFYNGTQSPIDGPGVTRLWMACNTHLNSWINYTPTLTNAMSMNPKAQVISIDIDTTNYPSGVSLDSICRWSSGRGSEMIVGKVILLPQAINQTERENIVAKLVTEYNIDVTPPGIIVSEGSSSEYGHYAAPAPFRLANYAGSAGIAAGTEQRYDAFTAALPGDNFAIGMLATARKAYMTKLLGATARPRRIAIVNFATNDLIDVATTDAAIKTNIVAYADFLRTTGATIKMICTARDRRNYSSSAITDSEYDAKRESVNAFVRANVYPTGHSLAGQKMFDAVADVGAQLLPVTVTTPYSGATYTSGSASPIGANGACKLSANWACWGDSYWSSGIGAGPATTDDNDNIHLSRNGAFIEDQIKMAALTPVLPTSVSISPSAPTVAGSTTQQFSATVLPNTANQAVTWETTAGSINSSGLFTAPATTGSVQTITITARSTADTSIIGTTTVTVPLADVVAPVLTAKAINAAGNTLTLSFTEVGSLPLLPATGVTGFTISGGHSLSSGIRATSTTMTFVISPVVYASETITLSYSGGNVTDSAPIPNALATITNSAVTNGSTQIVPSISSVSVAPSTANISGGATQQFTATVTSVGGASQTVTWQVSSGSINSSGLFTAPPATLSTQTITVTAISTFDNTKSSAATVTIPALVQSVTSVSVDPSTATVVGGATEQFTASVAAANGASQAVDWTATSGTINSSGLFTAPATTNQMRTITVTATSVFDPSKSDTATITVPASIPIPGEDLSDADINAIAAAVWNYSQRTISNTVVVGGGSILMSDEQGMETENVIAYTGDVMPLALTLTTSDGLPLSLSDYELTAVLSDASYTPVTPAPSVEIISPVEGKVIATVTVPASTGRYRLTVQREKGLTEKVTHGLIVLNVVRR